MEIRGDTRLTLPSPRRASGGSTPSATSWATRAGGISDSSRHRIRDFGFWRLQVESVRYIGGYGRMSWVDRAEWHAAEPDPLAPAAGGISAHMNQDHADALVLCARAFSRATGLAAASMTAIDRYGFEMSVQTPDGPRPVRVAFPAPIGTPAEARAALIAMVREAREALG